MRKIFFLIAVSFCLVLSGQAMAYAFAQGDQDCLKCHTLSNEKATKALTEMIPDVKILNITPSAVKGQWEVGIETGGRKIIVYLDYSGKHLIAGNLFLIQTKTNLTQEKLQDLTRVDVSQIPLKDAIVLGDRDAKYKVIVFSVPDWPYCSKLHQEMKKIIKERKDIAFFTLLFPLPMHKDAYAKSKAIVCEKSLSMLEDALDKKPVPVAKCETSAIDDHISLAQKLGISGTLAIVMPDGRLVLGYMESGALIQQIEKK